MKNIEHLHSPLPRGHPPLRSTLLHIPPPSTTSRVLRRPFPPAVGARGGRADLPACDVRRAFAQVRGVRRVVEASGGAPVGRSGVVGGAWWRGREPDRSQPDRVRESQMRVAIGPRRFPSTTYGWDTAVADSSDSAGRRGRDDVDTSTGGADLET